MLHPFWRQRRALDLQQLLCAGLLRDDRWDFATGIGSVNVTNLVMSWNGAGPMPALQVAPRTT